MTRTVTRVHRPKLPPKKRKAVALTGPAIAPIIAPCLLAP
jgi:hypothetical protein